MTSIRAALISICHGAGPLPALQHPGHDCLVQSLSEEVPRLLKLGTDEAPKAVVVVTAHWETTIPTISSEKIHKPYYDYFGFAKEAYSLRHDAHGSPETARRALELLGQNNIKAQLDPIRGWDHGVFIPMKLIDPTASVPILQVSVLASQDAGELMQMGRALSQLRDENVAIIGSGSPSYHNVRDWMSGRVANDRTFLQRQAKWHDALESALQQKDERSLKAALEDWRNFPHAYEMHPRGASEHFSTLLVCAGAAKDAAVHCSRFHLMGAEQTMSWWD